MARKQKTIPIRSRSGPRPLIVSWYGGIYSAGLLAGMAQRKLRPDLIVYASVGAEMPLTHGYLAVLERWLGRQNFPKLTLCQPTGLFRTLETACLERQELPDPWTGSCWKHFKLAVEVQAVKASDPYRLAVRRGEQAIWARPQGHEHRRERWWEWTDADWETFLPLVEWGWDRSDCERACLEMGLEEPPEVPHCFFCPLSTAEDVRILRDSYPTLLNRALRMEHVAEAPLPRSDKSWSVHLNLVRKEPDLALTVPDCQVPPCCWEGRRPIPEVRKIAESA